MAVLFEELKQQTVTRGTCVPRVSCPHKTMHRRRIAIYASSFFFFFLLQTSFYFVLCNCKPQVTPQLSGANFVFTMSKVSCKPILVMSKIGSGSDLCAPSELHSDILKQSDAQKNLYLSSLKYAYVVNSSV